MKSPSAPKPPRLGHRLQKAFAYAAEKHAGQTRKQTAVPYLSHLMAVAALVLEGGGDEDLAIAGLLHDVVEDCGGMPRLREIRKMFGARVAKVVEGCTDSFSDPKLPWLVRKNEYLQRLKHEDADTRLVSASDKLHNVRTVTADYRQQGESIWKRFSGGRDGTLWYYRALNDEFQRRKGNRITRELAVAMQQLEKVTGVKPSGTAQKLLSRAVQAKRGR
ncbi:MAG TPA: HD domain-containing protein [Terriglobales bacterium]|nr:HD domain-containing protein [Terriglobales bacterium]